MKSVPLRDRLALVLITDRRMVHGELASAVARALAGGVTAVMLREKDLGTADLVGLGRGVRDACRAAGAPFLVNHDLEAARELGADGVHLGYGAAAVAEARAALGADILVGRSTHELDEIREAFRAGADYATFGPVWDTPSKRGLVAPCGTSRLAEAAAAVAPRPVLALGGVTAARAAEVRRAGAAGIACIGAILGAGAEPGGEGAAAGSIRHAWESAA